MSGEEIRQFTAAVLDLEPGQTIVDALTRVDPAAAEDYRLQMIAQARELGAKASAGYGVNIAAGMIKEMGLSPKG